MSNGRPEPFQPAPCGVANVPIKLANLYARSAPLDAGVWSRVAALAILVVVNLLVSGCGFSLRAQPTLPAEMARTYVASDTPQSVFYRKLLLELEQNGVNIVNSPLDATAVLTVLTDTTGQRVLSVSARNIPREYEVFYNVSFRLENDAGVIFESEQQTRTQDYTYDETLVLGKAREESQIREAIASDLVRVVMFQLAAL